MNITFVISLVEVFLPAQDSVSLFGFKKEKKEYETSDSKSVPAVMSKLHSNITNHLKHNMQTSQSSARVFTARG